MEGWLIPNDFPDRPKAEVAATLLFVNSASLEAMQQQHQSDLQRHAQPEEIQKKHQGIQAVKPV